MSKDSKKKNSKIVTEEVKINGQTLKFEVGRFAGQANAAVIVSLGETMVLATVVSANPREDIDYFPLYVEYQEKLYAGGKIKGSRWVKREGRPSDEAILTARLIDRSIRPLFPEDYKNEVQVVVTILSVDGENDPDIVGICAVSAALSISDIPWEGPIGAVRVGLKDKVSFANPVYTEREFSDLDLIVSSKKDAIVMVEAGSREVSEKDTISSLKFGQETCGKISKCISSLVKKAGKKKQTIEKERLDTEIIKEIEKETAKIIDEVLKSEVAGKVDTSALAGVIEQMVEVYPEIKKTKIKAVVDNFFKKAARNKILQRRIRLDGRKPDQIRNLSADIGVLPRTHGSAVFERGETQALTIVTLGAPSLEQLIESMEREESKRYIHHYYMPPYSVGETGRFGWPSRREVGHGSLAERALEPVIPSEKKFPYTIRVVSELMSSNGSTSMASVCGSSLSLMDAGVPIKKAVAGIAMGLLVDDPKKGIKDDNYLILTDIQGLEDHIGDMDFKVAGTSDGITAFQMDIKLKGVATKVLAEALERAKKARLTILKTMNKAISVPRSQISKYAPKIEQVVVPQNKIGEVIGPGGRMIRKIIAETSANVDVEDDGTVTVTAPDEISLKKAVDWITGMTREVQVGEIFEEAEVKRIQPFGAFVEILPGRDGLVHVSRISTAYIKDPSEVISIGDKVKVKVIEIDEHNRINLSMIFDQVKKPAPRERVVGPVPRIREYRPRRDFKRQDRTGRRGSFDRERSFGNARDTRSSRPQTSQRAGFVKGRRPQKPTRKPLADWRG